MKNLFKGIGLFAVMLVIPFISVKAITYDNTLPGIQDLKVYENGTIQWTKSSYAYHVRIQNNLSGEYSTSLIDSTNEPPINLIELIESRCPNSSFGCDGSKTGTFKVLIQEGNTGTTNNTEFQVTYDGTKLSGTIVESATYTVTFDSNGGSAVASQTVVAGNKVTIPKNPTRDGYDFVFWSSTAGDINSPITANTTFTAVWLKRFEVLTGDKSTFYLESDKDLVIKVDAPLEDLEDVSVFDRSTDHLVSMTEGTDYTLEEGSTILTLKNSFLKSLAVGAYDINFYYNNASYGGATAYVLLNVKEGSEPIEEETSPDTPVEEKNPNTLDNISLYIMMLGLSVIGLVGIKVLKK